jgi:hypothetical protein
MPKLKVEVNVTESELAYLKSYAWLREAETMQTLTEDRAVFTAYHDFIPEHITERIVYQVVEEAVR